MSSRIIHEHIIRTIEYIRNKEVFVLCSLFASPVPLAIFRKYETHLKGTVFRLNYESLDCHNYSKWA